MAGHSIRHHTRARAGKDHRYRVCEPGQIQRVIVGAGLTTDHRILTKTWVDEKRLIPRAAIQGIIARAAVQGFVAIPAVDNVIARPANDRVIACAAFQHQPRRI